MTRGFITIATGKENYYAIAANLVKSYRHFATEPLPFALICDCENSYTECFDDVVIMENPSFSYLDKLELPRYVPYDETIFIDSDCLAYKDLNDFWDVFEGAADFAVLGKSFSLDYPYAWFKPEDVGSFGEQVTFLPDFIGGVYFIRKSDQLEQFSEYCDYIFAHYHDFTFRQFENPVDEPVISLAIALCGFEPTDADKAPICFYPHTRSFKSNISKGYVRYDNIYEPGMPQHSNAYLVHWGSGNTFYYPYTIEARRLKHLTGESGALKTAATVAGMQIAHHGKNGAVSLLTKLHLADAARSVKRKLFGTGSPAR